MESKTRTLRSSAVLLLAQAGGFWPVWKWYAARVTNGSDEPWGIAAVLAALASLWRGRQAHETDQANRLIATAAVLTVIYAVSFPVLPPLLRAALALTAMACSFVSVTGARDKLPVTVALLLLSLPLIASLQFYFGYPLRTLTAAGASALLECFGMDLERNGTMMSWHGRVVDVDAPCSGVKMLWVGSLLACFILSQRGNVTTLRLIRALSFTFVAIMIGNMVRAAVLFLTGSGILPSSPLLHNLIGAAAFMLVCSMIVAVTRERCHAHAS